MATGLVYVGYAAGGPEFSSDVSVVDTGEVTMPRTPAFLAYLGASDTNATGAGTTFTLGSATALTEVFDQNADFNTNGTFTAPVTGRYHFDYKINVSSLTVAMTTSSIAIITSNGSYTAGSMNPGAIKTAGNGCSLHMSVLADMDASDTATFTVTISGGAGDTAGVQGSATLLTYVSGSLEC